MRELIYTVLELEEWEKNIDYLPCEFCTILFSDKNKAVCKIRTRSKITNKLVTNNFACQECKEKFENNQIPKCDRCGRLEIHSNVDFRSGKYICDCVRRKEDTNEKELPNLPHERESMTSFYERQINSLREELNTAEVEAQSHLDAMEAFEVYNKKHRQELLDKIAKLEEENKQLKEQNQKIVPQELVNEIEFHKREITELKEQVEQLTNQQKAQVEVPPKDKGLKGFFKLGGKK